VTRARSWIARALLVELALLLATGVYLHFRYRPTATQTSDDIRSVDSSIRLAVALREVHRLCSLLFVATAVVAAVFAVWRPVTRRSTPFVAGALVVVAIAAAFTGLLLPWDQLALWAVTVGTNMRGYTWLFGDDRLRFVLMGGREIGLPTLRRWYVVHLALALPATALVTLLWQRVPATARQGAAEPGR
jgi:quinol---cytochrome c reductase cytochrome b subunit, bacillus type